MEELGISCVVCVWGGAQVHTPADVPFLLLSVVFVDCGGRACGVSAAIQPAGSQIVCGREGVESWASVCLVCLVCLVCVRWCLVSAGV